MKKIIFSIACLTFICTFSVHATTMKGRSSSAGCEYTDNMHIQGPAGTHIISLQGNGIVAKKINDTYFQIIGTCSGGSDGNVIAKIGTNNDSYSEITISDGQMMWNPEVVNIKNIGGYMYSGIDHPWSTFEYTLKFAQN